MKIKYINQYVGGIEFDGHIVRYGEAICSFYFYNSDGHPLLVAESYLNGLEYLKKKYFPNDSEFIELEF